MRLGEKKEVSLRNVSAVDFIFAAEAARILGCSIATIQRRCEEGRLRAWRTSDRGWWRIDRASVQELLASQARENGVS